MIAADVTGASQGATNAGAGIVSRKIKAVACNAYSGSEVKAELPGQLGLEETIHVGKNRAVGFVTIVGGALVSPGGFCVQAVAIPQKDIDVDAGKHSTFLLRGHESFGGIGVFEGEERAATNGDINLGLLTVGEGGEKKHGACERNRR